MPKLMIIVKNMNYLLILLKKDSFKQFNIDNNILSTQILPKFFRIKQMI